MRIEAGLQDANHFTKHKNWKATLRRKLKLTQLLPAIPNPQNMVGTAPTQTYVESGKTDCEGKLSRRWKSSPLRNYAGSDFSQSCCSGEAMSRLADQNPGSRVEATDLLLVFLLSGGVLPCAL